MSEKIAEKIEYVKKIFDSKTREAYLYNLRHKAKEAADTVIAKIKEKTGIDMLLLRNNILGKIKGDPFLGIEAQEVEYYGVNKRIKRSLIRKEINKDKTYKKQKLLRYVATVVLVYGIWSFSTLVIADTIMFYSFIYVIASKIIPIIVCTIYLISVRNIGKKHIEVDYKKNELLVLDTELLFNSFNIKKKKNIEKTEMWIYYDTITRMLLNEQDGVLYIWVPKENGKNCIIVNDEQLTSNNEFAQDYYVKLYIYYKKSDSLIKELELRSGKVIERP